MRPGPLAAACALVVVALASTVAVRSWSSGSAEEGRLVLERGTSGPASSTSEPPLASPSTSHAAVTQALEDSPAASPAARTRASARAEVPVDHTAEAERDAPPLVELLVVERSAASTLVPVPGARFRYEREDTDESEERLLGETDRRGRLARALPGPGSFRIRLDETSVPTGLTLSNLGATQNGVARFYRAGTTTEQTYELVATRGLTGVVRDGDGRPVEGAVVTPLAVGIDPASSRRARSLGATTSGPGGRFAWEMLPAGEYALSARRSFSPATSPRLGRQPSLLRYPDDEVAPEVYVDLRTRSAAGVELVFDPGGVSLRGRVVDDDDAPVRGAVVALVETRVLGGPWNADAPGARLEREGRALRTRTEVDGSFVFPTAPRNALRLEIRHDGASKLRTAVLGAACLEPRAREVDLTDAAEPGVDLGDLVVEALHPFELRGRVELPLHADDDGPDAPVFDARFPAGSLPTVDVEGGERPYSHFDARTGEFIVRCNTPRDAVEVALFRRSSPRDEAVFTFVPVANETREGVVLRFP